MIFATIKFVLSKFFPIFATTSLGHRDTNCKFSPCKLIMNILIVSKNRL